MVGRLREASLALREEMIDAIHRAGFPDVTFAQVALFRYEGPDGRQPTEIAALAQLSKQSVNDALRHWERLGYLKLKAHPGDGRARVVRLTARGRRLDAAIWAAGREVDSTWNERIGQPAWNTFLEVLDQLAQADSGATVPPA